MTRALEGRTVLVSGGSRGIGLAIAIAASASGANVVLFARSDPQAARLPGAVHQALDQVRAAGGAAIAVGGDCRAEADVERVIDAATAEFGGIDCCVNASSASALTRTEDLSVDQFDLMSGVNLRGTFLLTRAAIPLLRRSECAHILTVAPPLLMSYRWLAPHAGYTATRYGMTILGLGFAAEFAEAGIASNCLWPQSALVSGPQLRTVSVPPSPHDSSAVAAAAVMILGSDPTTATGNCYLDDEIYYSQPTLRIGRRIRESDEWAASDL